MLHLTNMCYKIFWNMSKLFKSSKNKSPYNANMGCND